MFFGVALVGQTFSQDTSASARAALPVEINGHHIGETLLQFMVAEGTPQMFQDCATLVLDPSTEKRYATEPKFSYKAKEDFTQSYLDWLTFKSRVDECVNLADGLKGKTIPLSSKSGANITFAENKLVQISLVFPEPICSSCTGARRPDSVFGPMLSFDDVLHDLTAKVGPPDTLGERQMQNGFGGIFTFPVAAWTSRPDVTIYATQDRDDETVTHLTTVLIQERAYGDRMVQLQNARPNAFQ
jgi:hypothetical protein